MLSMMIGGLAILLVLSAFFAASEAALFSLNRFKLQKYEKSTVFSERLIASTLSRPKRLIIDIVIGNNIVNIAASTLSSVIFLQLFGGIGLAISAAIMTVLLLIFGEILPKTFGVKNPGLVSRFVILPINFFSFIYAPIRWVFFQLAEKTITWVSSMFNLQKQELTEEELKTVIEISEKEGILDSTEKEMITGVLDFTDTNVGEIVTHRVDIIAINGKWNQQQVLDFVHEHSISKFPVFEGSIDRIIGCVQTKDLLLNPTKNYRNFIKPVLMVPETKKIHLLLKEFQEKNLKIAVVLDEYGGTEGIVTLEDILEEIFGEIHDEFEEEVRDIVKIAEGRFRLLGKAHIFDINQAIASNFSEEDFNTLNGLLLGHLGRVPQKGEQFSFKGWDFTVEKVSRRRVLSVVVTKHKKGGKR
jgi:putative hemolysin